MEDIIRVENLVKRYKKAKENAVDTISFSVERGEFFAFLGPNGAGKTTTISILTTTLGKTSGKVEIAGFDLDKNPKQVRQNIGVIFQGASLDLNLTAEENIRLHAALYGLYAYRPFYSLMPQAYKERVKELADVLRLGEEIFKPIRTFSGGMKRKLEIIRSLMHKPRVLFLDEPTAGLDPISRQNLWSYLRDVRNIEKTTVFLTTHYLEEAEEADHIHIIDKGKIVASGTPNEVKKDLVEEYLLLDASDRSKLTEELLRLDLNFVEGDLIKVPLDNGNTAQQAIQAIATPLSVLQIHTPTLEEAYLGIIENNSEVNDSGD
jgi:ABC-2 type transport system ATP-binding protein